jgi:hypothetical protein
LQRRVRREVVEEPREVVEELGGRGELVGREVVEGRLDRDEDAVGVLG